MLFFFKIVGVIHSVLYKLTNGSLGGNFNGNEILLLTTTGRKSGKTRSTPMMFVRDGDRYVVNASAGGSPRNPGWYWNATRGTHSIQIQVNDKIMTVVTEEVAGEQRDQLYQRFIEANNQYASYEKKAGRTIPVLILAPQA